MIKTPITINFGTDGFRGIIGDNFTFEAVNRISISLAKFIKGSANNINPQSPVNSENYNLPIVAIGYDTRFMSKEFAAAASKVISSQGIKVMLCDSFCPSPVLSYFVKDNLCRAGIMITASHNPYSFNGVKFKSAYGSSMLQRDVKKVEQIANSDIAELTTLPIDNFTSNENKDINLIIKSDFKNGYLEHIIDFTEFNKVIGKSVNGGNKGGSVTDRFEIVLDPMFGAGIGYLSQIFKRFSIKHHIINGHINPIFPGINPEPIDANLSKLKSFVKKIGARNKFAVGFATDGDADRIGAVDYTGNFVDSHKIFSVILNFLLREGYSGNIVKTVSVSKSIDEICKSHGLKLFEVPIGFKNIAELMINKENNIFMGGEESGGIGITSHIPERDGILNALMLLKIMIVRKKNLNELLNEIFDKPYPYTYARKDLYLSEEKKRLLIEQLKKGVFKLPNAKDIISTNFIDGFKFEYSDSSWLLIRPSGTEPLLRIYSESQESRKVNMIIYKVEEEICCLK